jgi:tetratricopeptide (TPR) repeat protein
MANYEELFLHADNARNNAQINSAIKQYLGTAEVAHQENEPNQEAKAWYMAGVSAKQNVDKPTSQYLRDGIEYFTRAENLFKALNDEVSVGSVYRDLGCIHDNAGLYDQALPFFEKSISVLEKTEAYAVLAISCDKLGVHFLFQGNLNRAEEEIGRAIELFKKDPTHGFFVATSLYDLARVRLKAGQFAQAEDAAEQSLSWYEADHDHVTYDCRRAQLYGLLSVIYAQAGQDKKAKNMAEKYTSLLKKFDLQAAKVIQGDLEKAL